MTAIEKEIDIILRKARTALGALSLVAIRREASVGEAKDIREKMHLIMGMIPVLTEPLTTLNTEERLWLAQQMATLTGLHGYAACKGSAWVKVYTPVYDEGSGPGFSLPLSGTQVVVYINGANMTVQQAITNLYAQQGSQRIVKISGGTV